MALMLSLHQHVFVNLQNACFRVMPPCRDEGMPDYNLSQELLEAVLPPLDTCPAAHAAPESMIGNEPTNSQSERKLLGMLVVHFIPSPDICKFDQLTAAPFCSLCRL